MIEPGGVELSQIRIFEAVAVTGSFSRAADRLQLAQSSVSHQIRTLERGLRQELFHRTTRRVALTQAGEAMLIYARSMLALSEQITRHFSESNAAGVLRLGIAEDFVSTRLSRLLRIFRAQHPNFQILVESSRSNVLFRMLEERQLDVVVAKRLVGRSTGRLLWRSATVWVGQMECVPEAHEPLPLIVFPAPSELRTIMLDALARAGRSWVIVMQCSSISSLRAAMEAGLGVSAGNVGMIPDFISALPDGSGLPKLDDIEFVVDQAPAPQSPAVQAFAALLSDAVSRMEAATGSS